MKRLPKIIARHNKLVDRGRTGWTTPERDRCRLLEIVGQLKSELIVLEGENKTLLKIKGAAKSYLEHGEPELADDLEALLAGEKDETE